MSETPSANGMTFGFTKPDTNKEQQIKDNATPPVEKIDDKVAEPTTESEKELNKEYVDKRSVTVRLILNHSLFRKVNDKTLPKKQDFIGSSIASSRGLCANQKELEAYFPNIIGVAPTDPSFIQRVKMYYNNIRIPVNELGRTFNNSFIYYKKKDYYAILAEENAIEEEYKRADRTNAESIRKALNKKIADLNIMESKKHAIGRPENVEEYLMYRHILLYHDVAKDQALINSDPGIRFYLQDDKKEENRRKQFRLELNKAKVNYVACIADTELFDAIYTQYCAINGLPIIASMQESEIEKQTRLDKFSMEQPDKFNKLFANPDIKLIAKIETLIARGILIRSEFNQNIMDANSTLIGANMKEAIVWFKNSANASIVQAYANQLKNL